MQKDWNDVRQHLKNVFFYVEKRLPSSKISLRKFIDLSPRECGICQENNLGFSGDLSDLLST